MVRLAPMTVALVVLVAALGVACAGAHAALAGRDARPAIRVISPQAHQVFQREASGRGVIRVSGRCGGVRGGLLVTWGPLRRVVRVQRDGTFRLRLDCEAAGQASLRVSSRRSPTLFAEVTDVGIGDVYVIAGQSNASGRGPHMATSSNPVFTAGLFGNDYRWRELRDPVDSPVGQVDAVSRDRNAGGSAWPIVATRLMAAEEVPVAFIPCARGNTTITRWVSDPSRPRSRRTLYGSMVARVRAAGGRVRAVLFLQGESDARWSTSPRTYAAGLRRFAAQVSADIGAPLVVGQLPDFPLDRYPATAVDLIRQIQVRAPRRYANVVLGPSLYDIDLGGSWHLSEPDDQAVAAQRWTAAILRGVLARPVPSPPELVSAEFDGTRTIDLRFSVDQPLAGGAAGGFTVEAGGDEVAVESGEVTGEETVRLILAADAPIGPLVVSLGKGRSGVGAPVPTESSSWSLSAPTCLRLPVSLPEPHTDASPVLLLAPDAPVR